MIWMDVVHLLGEILVRLEGKNLKIYYSIYYILISQLYYTV